ncbi:MAG TPA: hypothetical protein VLB12_12600, partial [Gemmatimonadales bacterium]|nr:hypothetical protein [Gemmatimonadales bacterium]
MTASLADAADSNLATHFTWVQQQTAGMRVRRSESLVLSDSGLPCDTFNAVCRARLERDAAAPAIHEALDWFAERSHPFSWWVGPGDRPDDLGQQLERAGLEPAESELAMALDLTALPGIDLAPNGLSIRRVGTPEELREYARINAANWSPPDPLVVEFYARAAPVILHPASPLWLYLGYVDATPVATAELTVGGGVVGLYAISTLAAYRRRGY